ncbi:MerR family transcriptional regulator [Sphaerisporangium krabiense]|uniref:DNA-binding transcriptional MerR regulator n=1 Tax=Sphaerisporangium krabiense TaxID=763782 RepID=A0A7W8Z7A2_9ACTN|nr:MerR family transcriptional regulator [Sphaerisporangium krabiense]MBB5628393.1 DNA-binding transcriptional MerR regulator [Sphaerisporangium krabiense]GII66868.1 MerR family transcriptional regulator [Sphaerisporangium krabiense]
MRIGELAAMVGVSTRTVRHYHHLGLLPEPPRLANGYREYGFRDAVALARVRHLAELGLTLDELRDALADDEGRELREVLLELDADLAREQEALAIRRERVAALLAEADLRPGGMVSLDMATMLRDMSAGGSKIATLDRELFGLMGTVAEPGDRARVAELMRPFTEPEALARSQALYHRLDELAGAGREDPRVAALAADLAAQFPDEIAAIIVANLGAAPAALRPEGHAPEGAAGGRLWGEAMLTELSPAQVEVFREIVLILKERE